jgi:integrase
VTPKRKRRDLAYFGRRGDAVRVFLALDGSLVRVQHSLRGRVCLTRSWPATAAGKREAVAWAETYYAERTSGLGAAQDLTLYEVWQRFSGDQFPHLRERTRTLYEQHWELWMKQFRHVTPISHTSPQWPGQYRAAREAKGLGVRSIRSELGTVRTIYRWALAKEIISRNPLASYRFQVGKESRPESPAEFRRDEFTAILAQLDPRKASQWRAWCAIAICGLQGARQNAVLHLQPDDIVCGFHDERGVWQMGEITWRARWDKVGREWTQPLRLASQVAIEIALEWRDRMGYDGPWLFPAGSTLNKGDAYDQQSLWWSLKEAEKRAGVEHQRGRSAHGLRRMLAGDVAAETGDFLMGLRAIGDTDPRRAAEYLKRRDDRTRDAFAALDESGLDSLGTLTNPQRFRNLAENDESARSGRPLEVVDSIEDSDSDA